MTAVFVRGRATPEELAAVLAVVSRAEDAPPTDPYTRWRAIRVAALHRTRSTSQRTG